jgi:hypothetical protein
MLINVGGRGYRDGVDISREEFYRNQPDWEVAPTTAAPSPEIFKQGYKRLASRGTKQILSIHISRSLSATMDVAQAAAEQTSEAPVEAFD